MIEYINDGGGNVGFTCPITEDDVARTRGMAFLSLSPYEQELCGGFNGSIYQNGLKKISDKNLDDIFNNPENPPSQDLSDNMEYENMMIEIRNANVRLKNTLKGFYIPVLLGGGLLILLNLFKK